MNKVKKLATGLAGSALLLLMGTAAHAQGYPNVSWSINVGTPAPVYAPAPVVMAPQPVYRPAPVLVAPVPVAYPAPVMVRPGPVAYYGAPGWERRHWHHERWEREHWDRRDFGRGHGHR